MARERGYVVDISGFEAASSALCRTSFITPLIVSQGLPGTPRLILFPTGSSAAQYCRAIVSLMMTTAGALSWSDPSNWRPFKIEAYIFIAAIYFTCCFAMSRYCLWIERRLAVGKAR